MLGYLNDQPTRFGGLRDAIDGISEKMLAHTLKILEEEGFVQRRDWNEKPPRVEYSLTRAGKKLAEGVRLFLAGFYDALKTRDGKG